MDPSLPPDIIRRIQSLEDHVRNLERQQNPVAPSILDLNDVSGQPTDDRLVLRYQRSTGKWSASPGGQEAGTYVFSASPTEPLGTLFCDGALYNRSDYPDLFAAIGTTYGSTSGSNFRVPNFLDRVPRGAGGSVALGATGGSSDLIVPSHTHTTGSYGTGNEASGYGLGASGAFTDRVLVMATPGANTGSAGSSGTGANWPPWLACYVYVRT